MVSTTPKSAAQDPECPTPPPLTNLHCSIENVQLVRQWGELKVRTQDRQLMEGLCLFNQGIPRTISWEVGVMSKAMASM